MKDAAIPRVEVILVPVGAEYQAVQRAMKGAKNPPRVIPIPAGPAALQAFLDGWAGPALSATGGILLMGLGGSLAPQLGVGDGVLIEALRDGMAVDGGASYACHGPLTQWLAQRLPEVTLAQGVTRDRVITTLAEKRQLGDRYGADVVDMEGVTLLQGLPDCPIAILRVISDDCHHELPDISAVIDPDGSLRGRVLAGRFLQRPIAALRLIRGSLQGLKTLAQIATSLFV